MTVSATFRSETGSFELFSILTIEQEWPSLCLARLAGSERTCHSVSMAMGIKVFGMPDLLLGIDIGSYSSKGVLVTPGGDVLATTTVEHEMSFPDLDGQSTTQTKSGGAR